jgi:hypothetical protein
VCETALGHSIGSAVEQAYQRDALIAKRRVLMADWADFCASDRAANVVRMDGGRQRPAPQTDDQSTIVGGIEFRLRWNLAAHCGIKKPVWERAFLASEVWTIPARSGTVRGPRGDRFGDRGSDHGAQQA